MYNILYMYGSEIGGILLMDVITYTNLRKNLAGALDKVNDDRSPILITRQKGEHAVLISLQDYNAMAETAYLLGSPENARRLHKSLESVKARKTVKKALIE